MIMPHNHQHLKDLKEIRSLMEQSTQFLSLSGLSGIFAGIAALLGSAFVTWYKHTYVSVDSGEAGTYLLEELSGGRGVSDFTWVVGITGVVVLISALTVAFLFSARNARRKGLTVWNSSARRLIINLFIPLIAGGLFCMILIYHNLMILVAPSMLIFYGLALVNASKYTLRDIRYLGISEVVLGLIASVWVGYGLFFWTIGFGVLHIVYGAIMFWKYESSRTDADKADK
jgi:hypothetical protein